MDKQRRAQLLAYLNKVVDEMVQEREDLDKEIIEKRQFIAYLQRGG